MNSGVHERCGVARAVDVVYTGAEVLTVAVVCTSAAVYTGLAVHAGTAVYRDAARLPPCTQAL